MPPRRWRTRPCSGGTEAGEDSEKVQVSLSGWNVAPVTCETDRFAQLDHPLLQVYVWFEVWVWLPPPEELVCEWKLWIILEDKTAAEVLLEELHHVHLLANTVTPRTD